jgi:hypothetical protein
MKIFFYHFISILMLNVIQLFDWWQLTENFRDRNCQKLREVTSIIIFCASNIYAQWTQSTATVCKDSYGDCIVLTFWISSVREWIWSSDRIILTGEYRRTQRKPVLLPLCPPQIPHGLPWARTQASTVRSRRLTAWLQHNLFPYKSAGRKLAALLPMFNGTMPDNPSCPILLDFKGFFLWARRHTRGQTDTFRRLWENSRV